ncbi:hypothetical protein GCM10023258_10150 [Terrabacter aeriphilus]|uniref:ABC transporter permease n=1 Tax=Terrabacter aeriphilus TaxID=515662 RepID=A0ABP9J747_9MICO
MCHPAGFGRRFWAVLAVGLLALATAVLTLAWPEWIEAVFGAEPDEGRGSTEQGVAVACAVVFLICVAASARIVLRSRPVTAE